MSRQQSCESLSKYVVSKQAKYLACLDANTSTEACVAKGNTPRCLWRVLNTAIAVKKGLDMYAVSYCIDGSIRTLFVNAADVDAALAVVLKHFMPKAFGGMVSDEK